MREYPSLNTEDKVFIKNVLTTKPEAIPPTIPHWQSYLLAIPPFYVFKYFSENSKEEVFVCQDGFIYERPYQDRNPGYQKEIEEAVRQISESLQNQEDRGKASISYGSSFSSYTKKHNCAPFVRKLIHENQPIKQYFAELEKMAGQEIPSSSLLPDWEWDEFFEAYNIPYFDKLWLEFEEHSQENNNQKVLKMKLYCKGPFFGALVGPSIHPLLELARVEYEGIE